MYYVLKQYTFPLLLAASLHVAAVWALYTGWHPETEVANVITPQRVMASLIVLDPPKVRPKVAPQQQQARREQERLAQEKLAKEKQAKEKQAQEKLAAEQRAKEKLAQEQAAQQKVAAAELERQRQEQARQERLAKLSELAQTSFDQAIESESSELQAGTEEQVVLSYHAAIYDLVRVNWSRPPSARMGMSARLQVELIPTGEVVTVTVIDSSGNTAFDRSAEQAVRAAKRFVVPDDNALFEKHFRRFYFLFQPEDLLR